MMKVAIVSSFCVLSLCAAIWPQASNSGAYESRLENDVVAVYDVNLPAHASAPNFQSGHDTFWIALNDGVLGFIGNKDSKKEVRFQTGDTRYFASFEAKSLVNDGADSFHGVLVALKPRGLTANNCECDAGNASFVCGCSATHHLDPLWALALGNVTLAGTTLSVGEAFRAAPRRDDMLLVAVSDIQLEDQADENSNPLVMRSGQAAWVRSGRHQFKNVGETAARFVTIEF
jgi:hypothetical protein